MEKLKELPEKWVPKVGEWAWSLTGDFSSIRPNPCQITEIDKNNNVWCKDYSDSSYCSMESFLSKYRKALPEEIPQVIENQPIKESPKIETMKEESLVGRWVKCIKQWNGNLL